MKKQPYLPASDSGKREWLNNFAIKLAVHQATLSITGAQLLSVQKDAAMWDYLIGALIHVDSDVQELTAYKDIVRSGPESEPTTDFPQVSMPVPPAGIPAIVPADIFKRIAELVQTIKNNPAYTQAIGEDLKVIGAESNFDANTYQPTIKAKVMPAQVIISFSKSKTDGVNVYARLKGQSTWVFLALDTSSPYVDTRPLANPATPENREYRVRGVIDNVEIGLFSDIVSATFGG